MPIDVLHFTDPACPWAYSASPAHAVLRWRYGAQLRWRLVTIGLTETAEQYAERGYTPEDSARGYRAFRRYGMPFATAPKSRLSGTSRACRAIVATRLRDPAREHEALRALQFAQFTSTSVLDDDGDLGRALERVAGLDAAAVVAAVDDPQVIAAYEDDKARSRTAAGSPTEMQGKARVTDGPVRYSAPSLIFRRDGAQLEAGGFQPVEAYDAVIANLAPSLDRTEPPADPLAALVLYPGGLTTQEVAAVMALNNAAPDRGAAEDLLIGHVADGRARREPLGDDALWVA